MTPTENLDQKTFWERIKIKSAANYERLKAWASAQPKWLLSLKIIGGLSLIGFLAVLSLILLVRFGAFGTLPSLDEIREIQTYNASEIYASDDIMLGKFFIENRTNTTYKDLSPHIVNALIATEDARFFQHQGVDIMALCRVLFKTILWQNESSGGGSTLSQQLAKNLYKRDRTSIFSLPIIKIREMFIARRLEKVYPKEELLSIYLNTVPFGGNVYGIKVAAKHFFSAKPNNVKIEEAAMLIGMLKANTKYNPKRNPEAALNRRDVVLNQMHKYEYLDKKEVDSLKALPINLNISRESANEGLATYLRDHLRGELKKIIKNHPKEDGTTYNIYTDGLKIYTTIDSKMQRYAEEAVALHMAKLQKEFDAHWRGDKPWGKDSVIEQEKKKSKRYKQLKKAGKTEKEISAIFKKPVKMTIFDWKKGDIEKEMSPLDSIKFYYCMLNAGFLALDQYTGDIKAWVGGIDHQYFQYDHVKSKRQVGSTFKPIVYATALEQGIRPCDYTHNRLVIYTDYDDWKPENASGKYGGVYSMKGALTKSVNSVAVDLILRAQIDSVVEMAHKMGIRDEIPSVPSIALGAVNTSLYDMLKVYGTIANGGKRMEVRYIKRVEDKNGKVIVNFDHPKYSEWEQVLLKENALLMTNMMRSVVDGGTARRLRYEFAFENDIAGKTGTTQNHSDGWFMGFTPHLVAGVWVGGESPRIHFRSLSLGSGGNMALPIWGHFMKKLYGDRRFAKQKFKYFEPLPDSLDLALNCPDYLDEMPTVVDDIFLESPFQTTLNDMIDVLEDQSKRVNVPRGQRKKRASTSIESERIRKRNERIKERKKRKKRAKNFWDKFWKD